MESEILLIGEVHPDVLENLMKESHEIGEEIEPPYNDETERQKISSYMRNFEGLLIVRYRPDVVAIEIEFGRDDLKKLSSDINADYKVLNPIKECFGIEDLTKKYTKILAIIGNDHLGSAKRYLESVGIQSHCISLASYPNLFED